MATKQEVADFINAINTSDIWSPQEIAYVQAKIDPFFAQCLIKLIGDVSWLVEVRDNMSQSDANRDMFE